MISPRIIVALDFPDAGAALALADRLDPASCAVKIGNELFTAEGPGLVRACTARGFRVFLDLKFHDIPNSVAQACDAATRLGVWMLNVHASGGVAMLAAARDAVDRAATAVDRPRPLLIAVTVLTSLAGPDLETMGITSPPEAQVLRLAKLARSRHLDGVVCSAREASALRAAFGPAFLLVTPGIRLDGGEVHDQARIATPQGAMRAGADYLVIGRAITHAADPRVALAMIRSDIGEAA